MSVHMIYYKDGAKMMSPVLTETEYRNLRNSDKQKTVMKAIRGGDEGQKTKLLQMNYSCLPNEDGSLTARAKTIIAHTPAGRFAEPEELFGTIHYLISDASSFVTGVLSVVDGGFDAFSI